MVRVNHEVYESAADLILTSGKALVVVLDAVFASHGLEDFGADAEVGLVEVDCWDVRLGAIVLGSFILVSVCYRGIRLLWFGDYENRSFAL